MEMSTSIWYLSPLGRRETSDKIAGSNRTTELPEASFDIVLVLTI